MSLMNIIQIHARSKHSKRYMHLFHEIPKGTAWFMTHALRRQCKQRATDVKRGKQSRSPGQSSPVCQLQWWGLSPLKGPGVPLLPWTFSDLVTWSGWVRFLRCQHKWPQYGGPETPDIYFSHSSRSQESKIKVSQGHAHSEISRGDSWLNGFSRVARNCVIAKTP